MNTVLGRQLRQSLLLSEKFKNDLRFELSCIVFAIGFHCASGPPYFLSRFLGPSYFGDLQTEALKSTHEKEVMALYQEIGQLTTQLAWLKKSPGSAEPCTTQRVGRARVSGVSSFHPGLPSGSVPIRTVLQAGLSLHRGGGSSAQDRRDLHPLAILRESSHCRRSPAGRVLCGTSPRPNRHAGDGNRGDPSRAQPQQEGSRAQDLSLSSSQCYRPVSAPYLGNRHHLHPLGSRMDVSCGHHRLAFPFCCLLGAGSDLGDAVCPGRGGSGLFDRFSGHFQQ